MKASGGGVALIPTAPEQTRNRDTHFPYRADSYFQYLTGFTEPEAVLVISCGQSARCSAAGDSVLPRKESRT
jgi:Xaa-Pro aminopeptidase